MKRVLLTGMSGTGKSTIICELAARGFKAVDLDTDEFSEWVSVDPGLSKYELPAPNRDWVWREDRVQELLALKDTDVLFVSGCAENMKRFLPQFDKVVLLSAPADVIVERLHSRRNNQFGKHPEEVAQTMAMLQNVEPLLRMVANVEIDTNSELSDVVDKVIKSASLP